MISFSRIYRQEKGNVIPQKGWYVKTGAVPLSKNQEYPIYWCAVSGHFIGVELKGPKGRPSDLQIYNLRQIDRSGGYAVLLYPD